MDQRLAEIYHTNEEQEADVEKLAAAELAETLEEDGAIDLDGLDEEQLNALAEEVLGEVEEPEDGEPEKTAETEEEPEEPVKLAEADFQQADQMGRIMAHAFVQENREIEKTAARLKKNAPPSKKAIQAAEKGSKGIVNKIRTKGKRGLERASAGIEKGERKAEGAVGRGLKRLGGTRAAKFVGGHAATVGKGLFKHRGKVGLGLAGAGGVAAAMKRKEASAIDTLATQRAEEILAASQVEEPRDQYDVLADVVEQRAHEILAENGYEMVESEEQE